MWNDSTRSSIVSVTNSSFNATIVGMNENNEEIDIFSIAISQ